MSPRVRLQPGDDIAGYRLLEKMPSGGMASLWKATHPAIDGLVALKIPFLDPGADASVIVAFETEALILGKLSGPHVPRFHGAGDLRDIPFIAMEFVTGESLAAILPRLPLPAEDVRQIGIEVATALSSLHRQQVVHLDLKPENIFRTSRGAVLIDFGLARHAELPDLLGEESTEPMGSAAYIAPEQILGERSDAASDLFALGCILYQLATGEEPFGRPGTPAGMRRRLFQAPAAPRAVNPAVPRWLEEIILRCLEVDRARRYADAAQLLIDLRSPDQVRLRDRMPVKTGWRTRLRNWFSTPKPAELVGRAARSLRDSGPAVVLVAVDLTEGSDALAAEVRLTTSRVLHNRPDSRLACITVLKTEILGQEDGLDAAGRPAYLTRLVALRDWARPFQLADERISYHVLEAVSPADAILEYAARNDVGHIVIGARGSSALRRHLGSVSAKVVAAAQCSVSVVRVRTLEDRLPPGQPGG